jgi:D-sedoheptulose 7-phosphate isomerase
METPDPVIAATLDAHLDVVAKLRAESLPLIADMAARLESVLRNGGKICFFGNGGSAADSQHLATEFVVRFTRQRRALASIAFTTDTSLMTAAGNDFGFQSIFARQVEGLCSERDAVIGISTSGTSANVVRGLEAAKKIGALTIAFTAADGADCGASADLTFCAPSTVTARAQECHLLVGHILCDLVEAAFAGE